MTRPIPRRRGRSLDTLPTTPAADGRPLTYHLLDLLALAHRPVALAELHAAVAADPADIDQAVLELYRRGRFTYGRGGDLVWAQPTRELRPTIAIS